MKILGLSAHTDDIDISSGGKLVKDIEAGHEIKVVVFSYCQESLPDIYPKDKLKIEFLNSMKIAGIENTDIYDYPVRRFNEHRQDILDDLLIIRDEFDPDTVITHRNSHQDHLVIAMESIRAFKNSASMLAMQMPHNDLQFKSQYYEKLDKSHIEKKIEMLNQYESQYYLKRKIFNEELIWSWARLNGLCCNADFAEVFEVIRFIR